MPFSLGIEVAALGRCGCLVVCVVALLSSLLPAQGGRLMVSLFVVVAWRPIRGVGKMWPLKSNMASTMISGTQGYLTHGFWALHEGKLMVLKMWVFLDTSYNGILHCCLWV